ncbi:MAG: hypothetical protein ACMV1B_01915 [Prevotella sp.]
MKGRDLNPKPDLRPTCETCSNWKKIPDTSFDLGVCSIGGYDISGPMTFSFNGKRCTKHDCTN